MTEQVTVQKGHPKGLWVLFGTEMWERFNFYGMRTILTLFIVNALMMSKEQSSIIYGGFLGLCYLTPMLGGFIADRFFRKQALYYTWRFINGSRTNVVIFQRYYFYF